MPDKIRCPFCNFETTYPEKGRVSECLGECYSTYTLVSGDDDRIKTRMRLVEVFFLNEEFTPLITPDEIDLKCEFKTLPGREADEYIVFAREMRVEEHEIEKLKQSGPVEIEIGVDTMDRLHASLDRFERDLRDDMVSRDKLINEIKVVEKIVQVIREKLELTL